MPDILGLIIALFLLTVAVTVFLAVARGFAHVWLDYRIKRTFLEKAARNPQLLPSTDEIPVYLGQLSPQIERNPQHFGVTGVILALIGALSAAAGYGLYAGQLAVGLYFGGITCIAVGTLMAAFAFLLQWLRRPVERTPSR